MVVGVMPDVRIPEQEERRPPRQCNLQKGKFIADTSQGSCHIQRSGVGSESPEPKLLHRFIGWAHTVGSWFKQIGYKFAKQFHWSNTLKTFARGDFPGGFRPVPNWQTEVSVKLIGCIQVAWYSYHPEVGRPPPNLSCLPWRYCWLLPESISRGLGRSSMPFSDLALKFTSLTPYSIGWSNHKSFWFQGDET